jgi:hypothetical protein
MRLELGRSQGLTDATVPVPDATVPVPDATVPVPHALIGRYSLSVAPSGQASPGS